MSAKLIDTSILLYAKKNHHLSHRVCLSLAVKHLNYKLVLVEDDLLDGGFEDLADINPYNSLPTLIDRELVLYENRTIIDYLEERFKGVKLLPDTPAERAKVRQLAWRIEKDWLVLADILLTHPDSMSQKEKTKARNTLSDSLTIMSPLFSHKPYFLSDTFGLCDCLLAPMLWRLDEMQISLSNEHCKALNKYMQRIFSLDSFKLSLNQVC